MPVFDYKCSKCGKEVEKFVKGTSDPIYRCENCDGMMVKQISSPKAVLGLSTPGRAIAK